MATDLIAVSETDLDESERLYEEIDGQFVEAPTRVSAFANLMAGRIFSRLHAFCEANDLGFATMESLFQLALPVQRKRRPDVAFVSRSRWPKNKPVPRTGNALDVTPTLMLETISPTDFAEAVIEKVREYFRAGAEQVWLVYPNLSLLQCFENPTLSRWLTRDDTVANVPFLPGFQLALREIFPESQEGTPP